MNYLTFIDRIAQYNPLTPEVQFIVSGNDQMVRNAVLNDIVKKCRKNSETLIVVDDTGVANSVDFGIISSLGYQVRNGLSGEYCLYNPLQIANVKEISRMRQLLETLGYDEKQKAKLIAYLKFIQHIECLENGSYNFEFTIEKLSGYCTSMAVEEKLNRLVETNVIDEDEQMMLLAKYSECSSAAADFEDMFFVLLPFINGDSFKLKNEFNQALVFPIDELGEDESIRNLVIQLLQFGLEDNKENKTTLLVLDKGYGNRKCIFNLVKALPSNINIHILSEDIFTLCDETTLAMILNRFTARIYSRHIAMSSAEAIEKACGEIDVIKNSYNVAYDRRWRANRPWDVLMGNNKTETYTQTAPVREPRYRKEMIMGLLPGNGIVEYMGNTSVFSI